MHHTARCKEIDIRCRFQYERAFVLLVLANNQHAVVVVDQVRAHKAHEQAVAVEWNRPHWMAEVILMYTYCICNAIVNFQVSIYLFCEERQRVSRRRGEYGPKFNANSAIETDGRLGGAKLLIHVSADWRTN